MELNTKYPGTCRSCGASIPAGNRAQYRKGAGIACIGCPPPTAARRNRAWGFKPNGYYASKADPNGLYTPSGRCIARLSCGHEDYPCCGC